MLNIQFIRDNLDTVKTITAQKGYDVDFSTLMKLDAQRSELITEQEALHQQRNEVAKRAAGKKPTDESIQQGRKLKEHIKQVDAKLNEVEARFSELLARVPNLASDDTPIGKSEDENKVLYEWGKKGDPKSMGFTPANHWEIAETKGWIDKERAAKVAGARFAYLLGGLVELQIAIELYVMQLLSKEENIKMIAEAMDLKIDSHKPFKPVLPPHMIRTEVFDAMDRLQPSEDRYKIEDEDLWLQGSAEHVIGAMHMDEIIPQEDLPLRYIGFASSYRREAGTYGKDMEGIIRMHQFDKLEMEIFAAPEQGMNEHLLTIAIQEYMMRQLNIPYRKLLKCTADIGKPNFRGVDLDAWLPGQGNYRETHTADFMTDYQTRRLGVRTKLGEGPTVLLHTIDATAFALGRTMVAIIENYQTKDGDVRIPNILQQYMGNREFV